MCLSELIHICRSELTQNQSYVESVFVKVSLQRKTFIVKSVYRPSNSEIEPFISFFDSLRQFNVDFNIDLLKVSVSDSLAVQFYITTNSLSMMPTITRPTRIARTSSTLLDNFLVTNLRNFKNGLLSIDITDDLPIFSNLRIVF